MRRPKVALARFFLIPITLLAVCPAGTSMATCQVQQKDDLHLRLSFAAVPPEKSEDVFAFRVTFENTGVKDKILNLGYMLANGRTQLPVATKLTLTYLNGTSTELSVIEPWVAGRVDDYIVPLRAGSTYSITLGLDQLWYADCQKVTLLPGRYSIHAEFTGTGAKYLNGDTPGLELMNFWKGTLRSAEVAFQIH